jgi:hypothetical protein
MADRRAGAYRLVTGRLTAGGIELHVLARAYRAAWIAMHSAPPAGRHRLADLGLAIDFGQAGARRKKKSRASRTAGISGA